MNKKLSEVDNLFQMVLACLNNKTGEVSDGVIDQIMSEAENVDSWQLTIEDMVCFQPYEQTLI